MEKSNQESNRINFALFYLKGEILTREGNEPILLCVCATNAGVMRINLRRRDMSRFLFSPTGEDASERLCGYAAMRLCV